MLIFINIRMANLYEVEKTKNYTLESLLEITELGNHNTFLDFGGNRGNLLGFDEFCILPENYTCIDVFQPAIQEGQRLYPDAQFIHYNKYNCVYNTTGDYNCPYPVVDKNQDIIFAFSVFTHTSLAELKETIQWFKTFNYKTIALSVLDINSQRIVDWFYNKRVEEYGSCVDIPTNNNVLYLIDNHTVITNEENVNTNHSKHFLTLYNLDWLEQVLNCKIKYYGKYPFIIL